MHREDRDGENSTPNAPSYQLPVVSFDDLDPPSNWDIELVVTAAELLAKLLGESFNGQRTRMVTWLLEGVHEYMNICGRIGNLPILGGQGLKAYSALITSSLDGIESVSKLPTHSPDLWRIMSSNW